jgi:hypothetical protein
LEKNMRKVRLNESQLRRLVKGIIRESSYGDVSQRALDADNKARSYADEFDRNYERNFDLKTAKPLPRETLTTSQAKVRLMDEMMVHAYNLCKGLESENVSLISKYDAMAHSVGLPEGNDLINAVEELCKNFGVSVEHLTYFNDKVIPLLSRISEYSSDTLESFYEIYNQR